MQHLSHAVGKQCMYFTVYLIYIIYDYSYHNIYFIKLFPLQTLFHLANYLRLLNYCK